MPSELVRSQERIRSRGPRQPEGKSDAVGGLVISLDFELAWGVFDTLGTDRGYLANLMGARQVIPRMLELFQAFDVAATWATVGFLFAESREELEWHSPPHELRPRYDDPRRNPYELELGADERSAPLQFAPSLIRQIAETPRQEIASHTFSHYLAREPGQTYDMFLADLKAAVAIGRSHGHEIGTLVMPRHQTRVDYLPAYLDAGFTVHRGNEPNLLNAAAHGREPLAKRGARLLDSYVNITGASTFKWEQLEAVDGLHDVPESRFFRPPMERFVIGEKLRLNRIASAMEVAARRGEVFHLWWHPHNFGAQPELALALLKRVLTAYKVLQQDHGFLSLNMREAAQRAALHASP